jgi:hypothetical protein
MTIVSVCSAAGGADEAGAVVPEGAGPDAEGAGVDWGPPHAATMIAPLASRPKRRLCINCPPKTGD